MVSVETLTAALAAVVLVPTITIVAIGSGYALARLFGLDASLDTVGQGLGVNRWAALGPTVGASAVLGYVEFRTDLPMDGEPGDLAADIALLALFGGAFALAVGIGNLPRYRRVRRTDAAIDATDRAGRVTVSGTAETADGEERAPLSGEPCLAWALRVREHRGLSHRGHPGVVHEAHGGEPFVVRDATGRVRVDPEALPLEGWSLAVGPDGDGGWRASEDLPERVTSYRDEHDLGPDPDHRIYEERRLAAGDDVTASGTVERRQGLGGLSGDGFLRAVPADELRQGLRRRARVGVVGAAAMVAGTVGLLAVTGLV